MNLENFLTTDMRKELQNIIDKRECIEMNLEEIRIRVGKKTEWIFSNGIYRSDIEITEEGLMELMNYLTDYSWYSYREAFNQGYFTINGGHRVGVVGRMTGKGGIEVLSDVGAINIRVAHEVIDCGRSTIKYIRDENGVKSTLIFSVPGSGKTSVLRDYIRILSGGKDGFDQIKVGVVDERSEIGACYKGIPQNDLGDRTDVMDNCPKRIGMKMLLRSMSPEVIAVDELGSSEDLNAVREIIKSGISVLGTVHAESLQEIIYKKMNIFQRYVKIRVEKNGVRRYEIYNERGEVIC